MRRPHVYERSAPRLRRSAPAGAAEGEAASRRYLARLIATAILEAEALGLAEVAAALAAAERAAALPPAAGDDLP